MCWILCLGLCCWFQFLNGIGSVTWPYSWAHRPPQPFFHLRIMGLYYSPILPTVTLYSVFSMPFSLSHNRFLSGTGHNHGPTCGQSLPTLTLGFAWWLTVAGRSAATVTQTGCPPSLALLFPADLEVQGSIKISPSHLWGTIRSASNTILHQLRICPLTTEGRQPGGTSPTRSEKWPRHSQIPVP